jgi:hypothetical protein
MRARWIALLIVLGISAGAGAQVSYVTAIGANANYPNGTLTANFVAPAGSSQLQYLNLHFPFTVSTPLDSAGNWSLSVVDTSSLSPAPSGGQWRFTLCSQAGGYVQPTCYNVTLAVTCINNGSCSGSTLNISSSFTAAPVPAGGAGIANIQLTVGTTQVPANGCLPTNTTYNTATMTGAASTNTAVFWPAASLASIAGWTPATPGLYFNGYFTANTLNWQICNNSSTANTPGASTTWNVSAK